MVLVQHINNTFYQVSLNWYLNLKPLLNVYTLLFYREFEQGLKAIKWPNVGLANDKFAPSHEVCNKLTLIAEYLFLVRLLV